MFFFKLLIVSFLAVGINANETGGQARTKRLKRCCDMLCNCGSSRRCSCSSGLQIQPTTCIQCSVDGQASSSEGCQPACMRSCTQACNRGSQCLSACAATCSLTCSIYAQRQQTALQSLIVGPSSDQELQHDTASLQQSQDASLSKYQVDQVQVMPTVNRQDLSQSISESLPVQTASVNQQSAGLTASAQYSTQFQQPIQQQTQQSVSLNAQQSLSTLASPQQFEQQQQQQPTSINFNQQPCANIEISCFNAYQSQQPVPIRIQSPVQQQQVTTYRSLGQNIGVNYQSPEAVQIGETNTQISSPLEQVSTYSSGQRMGSSLALPPQVQRPSSVPAQSYSGLSQNIPVQVPFSGTQMHTNQLRYPPSQPQKPIVVPSQSPCERCEGACLQNKLQDSYASCQASCASQCGQAPLAPMAIGNTTAYKQLSSQSFTQSGQLSYLGSDAATNRIYTDITGSLPLASYQTQNSLNSLAGPASTSQGTNTWTSNIHTVPGSIPSTSIQSSASISPSASRVSQTFPSSLPNQLLKTTVQNPFQVPLMSSPSQPVAPITSIPSNDIIQTIPCIPSQSAASQCGCPVGFTVCIDITLNAPQCCKKR
ncbi:hypothetical protein AB6A40_005184 [Gnathostoma spinigerum]|uniref:Uncharacterized protein n=1 Tax=Gnathostoma spinigerum TaxID=75299 RepID=A0ABD6EFU2_9BILA